MVTRARTVAVARSEESPRERILGAARALVLAKGHRRLALREVARRAGYSPASLYEHFDGKDAIVGALAGEASGALHAALSRAAAGEGPARERLVRIGCAYVRFARLRSQDFLLLFGRLPSGRRSLREPVPAASPYRVVLEAASRALEEARPRAARRGTAEDLAYGLWAAVHGMAMLQLTHLASFEADFERADRAVLEALLAGWLA
jgi:AcrR family transcriptional regulator